MPTAFLWAGFYKLFLSNLQQTYHEGEILESCRPPAAVSSHGDPLVGDVLNDFIPAPKGDGCDRMNKGSRMTRNKISRNQNFSLIIKTYTVQHPIFTHDFFTMFIHFAPTPPEKQPTPWPFETAEPLDLQVNEILEHFGPLPGQSLVWSRAEPEKTGSVFGRFYQLWNCIGMSQEIRING